MGLFDKFFSTTKATDSVHVPAAPPSPPLTPKKVRVEKPKKTAKEIATEKGEPYVAILNVELDPENIGAGAFELDWNDKFLAQLVRSGYQVRPNEPENEIVDRWFQDVCRNVVLETYEQLEANNPRGTSRKDIGNGRTEIS